MQLRAIFIGCLAFAVFASCNNATKKEESNQQEELVGTDTTQQDVDGPKGKIAFVETEFNFGTVKEGEIVNHTFKFKNEGEAPVILSQVSASCGCTTPDYTKEPILPGKEGEIKVIFHSEGQVGNQQKIVTISSNAENRVTTVQIKGTVESN